MLQVQEIAQVIAEEGLGVGAMVGIFAAMGAVVVLLLDRLIYMLQQRGIIPKKAGNPNGQVKLDALTEKVDVLYDLFVPEKVGEKPQFLNWLPVEEFMEQQEENHKILSDILTKVSAK